MVKLEPHDIDTQPTPLEWDELWQAMKRCQPLGLWVETTEAMFDEMLNVLPPAAHRGGGFLVGEAHHHDPQTHEETYAGFLETDVNNVTRFFARYLSIRQFNRIIIERANIPKP